MKKNKQIERLELTIKFLSRAEKGVTISEIHKFLVDEHHLITSRKTIERDVSEIVKKGFFVLDSKSPLTVYPNGVRECIIHLTNEEITYLLVVLPEDNPLRERLKIFMGLDKFCLDHES